MVSYQPQETPPVVGTTATYTCNEGYTLDGTNVRTCLQAVNNGTWTSINPSCNGEYVAADDALELSNKSDQETFVFFLHLCLFN